MTAAIDGRKQTSRTSTHSPKADSIEVKLGTRYGQARQVPIFQVPKLRRALSSRQSGSRTRDHGRRISLPRLRWAAYSPRWSVRPEIFSVARSTPRTGVARIRGLLIHPATKPGGSRRTSPSCRSWCGGRATTACRHSINLKVCRGPAVSCC